MTRRRGLGRGRTLAVLLLLNLVTHFIPFERPGFQPDDFTWLRLSRLEPPWSFVGLSLSQPTRPLGWLLYILIPKLFGLHESAQLTLLITSTSVLTTLVYVFLARLLNPAHAALAALAFVAWPVKHEIYASQLFGVITLSGILIVSAGLFWQMWARSSSAVALCLSVLCYGVSIFIYEIGYLAPLVFLLTERPKRPRPLGLALFLMPAGGYWLLRFVNAAEDAIGNHHLSLKTLMLNLVTSLPSNLAGFQVARNVAYGLWGFLDGPVWLQIVGLAAAGLGAAVAARWISEARSEGRAEGTGWSLSALALLCAGLLTLPAAMVGVESRHTMLSAVAMGVAIAIIAIRSRPAVGAFVLALLLLSTQGLALRQAEVSRLQASVYNELLQRRDEIRSARVVIVNIASLADRVSYTWGEQTQPLRAYWGLHAFARWGFEDMMLDILHGGAAAPKAVVRVCAAGLSVSNEEVRCHRDYVQGRSFVEGRQGALIIGFKAMPLPF